MCNFKFLSYCKGIVLFHSHLCNFIVIVSEINCVNVNVNVNVYQKNRKNEKFVQKNTKAKRNDIRGQENTMGKWKSQIN